MPAFKINDIVFAAIAATCLLILLLIFIVCFVLLYQRRKQAHQKAMGQLKYEQELLQKRHEEELLRTQLEIQEQTLTSLSEEIHDNIGQTLSIAKLNIALVDEKNIHPMQEKISAAHQHLKKAMQDLRHLSHSLNADHLAETGLQQVVAYELDMIDKSGVIRTQMKIHGDVRSLDSKRELILFRIIQESLNNIIKHAGATEIIVGIQYLPKEVVLSIKDNGQGMILSKSDQENRFGIGIRNMQRRAQLIGAECMINSKIGEGTEVVLHLME